MEHWRKTSCTEPLPLGRRNNKRKLVSEINLVVHVQKALFNSPIHSAPNLLPCVHLDTNKMCSKQMRNMLWNGGMTVEAATSSKSNLEISDKNEHLEEKKKLVTTTTSTKQKTEDDQARARARVMNILHKFRDYCDKLSDMKEEEGNIGRVDLQSAKKVKTELGYSTGKQYVGKVPGIEIGDRFYYRMELHIVGLHRPPRSGIETMDHGGQKIATSIVVSGGYNDYWKDANTLIYCGHGGGIGMSASGNNNQEHAEDQRLKGGNLALFNSKGAKNPVRVIRGKKKMKAYYDQFPTTYIYDGLYTVEDMWKIRDHDYHKTVFNFKLIKVPGQT